MFCQHQHIGIFCLLWCFPPYFMFASFHDMVGVQVLWARSIYEFVFRMMLTAWKATFCNVYNWTCTLCNHWKYSSLNSYSQELFYVAIPFAELEALSVKDLLWFCNMFWWCWDPGLPCLSNVVYVFYFNWDNVLLYMLQCTQNKHFSPFFGCGSDCESISQLLLILCSIFPFCILKGLNFTISVTNLGYENWIHS